MSKTFNPFTEEVRTAFAYARKLAQADGARQISEHHVLRAIDGERPKEPTSGPADIPFSESLKNALYRMKTNDRGALTTAESLKSALEGEQSE